MRFCIEIINKTTYKKNKITIFNNENFVIT